MAGDYSAVNFNCVDNSVSQMMKMDKCIEAGMNACLDVALDLEENGGNAEDLTKLKQAMVDYVIMGKDLEQYTKAVENTKERIRLTAGATLNVDDLLDNEVSALQKNTTDEDIEQHPRIQEMNEKLWQIKHPGETMPTQMTSGAAAEDEDEDLLMSQAEIATKCPITQQEMVDPVRNKICKHSYERSAIVQHIAGGRGRRKCPFVGCGNTKPIVKNDLEDNVALKHTIERKNRQATHKK
ncbi:E3 SUMO-protein ligase NSE2-like [Saccoglossus kowalevskii]|uniref:E3 SUMO-protein ligase NSE2 n=1 Tax=Saccoglossus kowalevskii TaxID=10224 RepID=A0ABM0M5J4_SACKO|nr:PREDICTED: E3 SUMO-protein ligase NSE2-like [Saccoglossus kowalevskii]